jgi:hypothetical protein
MFKKSRQKKDIPTGPGLARQFTVRGSQKDPTGQVVGLVEGGVDEVD